MGVIRKGIGWDYGKIWAKFEIMPRNGRFLKIFDVWILGGEMIVGWCENVDK